MNDVEFQKLLDSDEPVVLYLSRVKFTVLFLFLLGVMYLLHLSGKENQTSFWIAFLGALWLLAYILFYKMNFLLLTKDYFEYHGFVLSEQIYWKDVSEFDLGHIGGISAQWWYPELFRYIYFDYYTKKPTKMQIFKLFTELLRLFLVKSDSFIQNFYTINSKQLVELMNNKRTKARKAIGRND